MIRSLWISKTGLDAQQLAIDVVANNLANVSTNGFKRSRPVFEDLLYQTLRQPGGRNPRRKPTFHPACNSAPACARSQPSAFSPKAT